MIFAPVAIAGASIFCIFSRYCIRKCCINSSTNSAEDSEETTSCCIKCCPPIFEPQIAQEGVPISRSFPFYSSISVENSDSNGNSSLNDLSDNDEIESSLESLSDQYDAEDEAEDDSEDEAEDKDVVDSRILIKADSAEDSNPFLSMSPPDLLLLTGDEAFKGYTAFLNKTAKAAQGPSIVRISFNDIKSKSFTRSFDLQEKGDDENSQMNDYDNEYLEKYKNKLLETDDVSDKVGTIGRSDSNSSEMKIVQFNEIAQLRSFKMDR